MVKVSVIVPVYNAEKYLQRCIKSLVNQTFKDYEIILVNDGSTDGSRKIIEEYAAKYSNIKVVNNKNRGIGQSRNQGVKLAKGKYISFVDSDDYITEDMLENMYNFSYENDLDIAVCDFYIFNEFSNKIIKEKIDDFGITNIKENKALIYNINHSPWNKIYKKSLFIDNKIWFPTNLKYEDLAVVVPLLVKASKIGKCNKFLNYYVIHSDSETTTMNEKVFDILNILEIVNKSCLSDKSFYSEIEYLNVQKITTYTVQQRNQIDKNVRNEFIDSAFAFLNQNFSNWKKSSYWKTRKGYKKIIEKNKSLTKLYCNIYAFFNKTRL